MLLINSLIVLSQEKKKGKKNKTIEKYGTKMKGFVYEGTLYFDSRISDSY